MAATDQAVWLNLYRRYITLPFNVYRTSKSLHETKNKKREPEWLYDHPKLRKNILGQRIVLGEGYWELGLFAKEFGQGVRQQRVRDKTKEKAGTSPSGPKNDPKNSKMKMLLTCSKSCKL